MLITLILPTLFFDKFLTSLYVDGLMGIFFAYILITYFTEQTSKFTFFNISLALFVLAILKPAGVGVAVLALFVIIMDICFTNRENIKLYFKKNNLTAAIMSILMPIVFILIAKFSWDTYLHTSNASISFDASKITLEKIINVLLRFNGTETQKEIMLNFLKAFISFESNQNYINFIFAVPPITYVILFMFIGTKMYYSNEDTVVKKRILTAGISLLISCAAYLFIQLCSYLFLFTEYEDSHLASFSRYMCTLFLGIYTLIIVILLTGSHDEHETKNKMPHYLIIFFVIITITGLFSFVSATVLAPFGTRSTIETRKDYEQINSIKDEVASNETVYFIDIGSDGYSYHVCDYIAYPVRLSGLGSIGTSKYYTGDIWTKIITPEELKEVLINNYNYLYIHKTGYTFNEEYGYLFGGEENISEFTLYYVDKSDSDVILKKID